MDRLVRPARRAIQDAIGGIEASVGGKTFDGFQSDWLLRHGIQRGLEIISEAARRIPADLRNTQPHIPWDQIIGIGNVLRHEYHRVSDKVVWNVAEVHLPPLKTAIDAIATALDDRPAP
jgi:uncharacterized protein with HEPN domain